MPAQKPQWFFQPRSHRNGAGTGDGDTAAGLTTLPAAMLQRHGARVLDPEKAAAVHGFQPPRSTVYRARTLLVPDGLLQDAPKVAGHQRGPGRCRHEADPVRRRRRRRAARRRTGPQAGAAAPGGDAGPGPGQRHARGGRRVGGPAGAARGGDAARGTGGRPKSPAGPGRRRADRAGAPAGRLGHHRQPGRPSPAAASPAARTAAAASPGRAAPTPTCSAAATRAPRSRSCSTRRTAGGGRVPAGYGRRPVVAVLDTGVRAHPWLDVEPDRPAATTSIRRQRRRLHRRSTTASRRPSCDEGEQAAADGDQPRQLIRHPWDAPVTADPLVGELDADRPRHVHRGHRAPGRARRPGPGHPDHAQRRHRLRGRPAVRARHAGRPDRARPRRADPAQMVDVVSLSLGYFDESAADVTFTSGLWQVDRGAARPGRRGRRRGRELLDQPQVLPGGVRAGSRPPGPVPLISVGALNPNGSKALFSDGGHWVTAWAAGAAVVSTYPDRHQRQPQPRAQAARAPGQPAATGHVAPATARRSTRTTTRGGFAVWSGTSFSAPLLAAHIARALLEGARPTRPEPGRARGRRTTANRALAALTSMGWPG